MGYSCIMAPGTDMREEYELLNLRLHSENIYEFSGVDLLERALNYLRQAQSLFVYVVVDLHTQARMSLATCLRHKKFLTFGNITVVVL